MPDVVISYGYTQLKKSLKRLIGIMRDREEEPDVLFHDEDYCDELAKTLEDEGYKKATALATVMVVLALEDLYREKGEITWDIWKYEETNT